MTLNFLPTKPINYQAPNIFFHINFFILSFIFILLVLMGLPWHSFVVCVHIFQITSLNLSFEIYPKINHVVLPIGTIQHPAD